MIETHTITSREQWLELRKQDITASVCAAVIGLHERISPLQLYLHHAGIVPFDDTVDSPSMRRGRLLEPVAIEVIKEMHPDWQILPARDYVRDPEKRLGATPDVYVRGTTYGNNGLGIIEIKNVEPFIFEKTWRDEDQGITPPMAASLQALLTKHLTGAERAFVAALRVGHGVELDLVELPETPGLIERLEEAAAAFWQSVEKREAPSPNFQQDAELVRRMHPEVTPQKTIDLTGNNRVPFLASEYRRLSAIAKDADEERKALKAEMLHLMGDAEFAVVNGSVVASAKVIAKKPHMVTPKPYRDIRFKEIAA